MKINEELVKQIARNSRLSLSEQEIKKLLPEVKEILDYFSTINKAPTEKLTPSFHPIEIKNITREDIPKQCLLQKEALQNTKHKQDGYFKGPKSI